MRRSTLALAVALLFFAVPLTAYAAPSFFPLVPCGSSGQPPCSPCHLFQTAENAINLILFGITGPVAAFIIVLSGGQILLSGGNPGMRAAGQKRLTNTLIGVAVILLAWVATNFLIKSLAKGNAYDSWYQFSCPAELAGIVNIETAFPTGQPPALPAPPPAQPPKLFGVSTATDAIDLCGTNYKCSPCKDKDLVKYITSAAGKSGISGNLIQAIIFSESSCRINPGPSGAGAYGLMQLKPATASVYAKDCGVTGGVSAAWLQSAENTEKVVCIGAFYLKKLNSICGPDPRNIAAGYNAGQGYCGPSTDCPDMNSCAGGKMRAWECPWDNRAHTVPNRGLTETKLYAPKVAACATSTGLSGSGIGGITFP